MMDEDDQKPLRLKPRLFKDPQTGLAVTVVYLGLIYGTLGIARTVQQTIYNAGLEPFFFRVLLVLSIAVLVYLLGAFRVKRLSNYLCLAVLVYTFYWLFQDVIVSPVEKLHFIQYGLLTFFVYDTVHFSVHGRFLYFWSFMAVFAAGSVDEWIQYFLPDRVYDPRDILMNGGAGLLTLVFIGFVLQDE